MLSAKLLSTEKTGVRKRLGKSFIVILLVTPTLAGCISSPLIPTPASPATGSGTELQPPSAPEPPGIEISGTISGLPGRVDATIVVKLPAGKGGTYGYHSNGPWEMSPALDEINLSLFRFRQPSHPDNLVYTCSVFSAIGKISIRSAYFRDWFAYSYSGE
jgi:hypothetical protein